MKKRGISPVIATVLLIAMVVVLGLIIFLWFRGLTQEAVTKFGKNVELTCADVGFEADYSGGTLYISHTGNVPIFNFKVKITEPGSHRTVDISNISGNWPNTGLRQGGTFTSEYLSSEFSGADNVLLIPVLLGTSDSGGQKTHVCDEQDGQEIVV